VREQVVICFHLRFVEGEERYFGRAIEAERDAYRPYSAIDIELEAIEVEEPFDVLPAPFRKVHWWQEG
jgi:hypothetical protein